jgi:hypothetical protein
VTRGLLDYVESEDELAAVLAHESAHVSKRHAWQQIGENVLFLVLANQIKGRNADELRRAADFYNILRTLNKSREHEAQADGLGLQFTFAAGYDPRGLVAFFSGLNAGSREPGRLEQFFLTHPSPRRRLETARRDPLVRADDPAVRATITRGYEARGLFLAAAEARAGRDPLRSVPSAPRDRRETRAPLPADVARLRRTVATGVEQAYRGLNGAYRAGQVSGRLQQVLLVNYQLDYRWAVLAARAYGVQSEIDNVYARTLRVLREAPPTFDALTAAAAAMDWQPEAPSEQPSADAFTGPAMTYTHENVRRGHAEVARAVERVNGAPRPLARAAQAALTVLADLNNPLYHPKGNAAWLRYGTLEGLVQVAESELRRADRASDEAWQLMCLARLRRYEARISELAPQSDSARRAIWANLTARRLTGGAPFPTSGLASGAATDPGRARPANAPTVRSGRGRARGRHALDRLGATAAGRHPRKPGDRASTSCARSGAGNGGKRFLRRAAAANCISLNPSCGRWSPSA